MTRSRPCGSVHEGLGPRCTAPPTQHSIHAADSGVWGLRPWFSLRPRGTPSMVQSLSVWDSVHTTGSIHPGCLHAGLGPWCRLHPQGESVYAAGSAHVGLRPRCRLSECGLLSPPSSGSVQSGLSILQAARDTRLSPHSRVPSLSPRGTAPLAPCQPPESGRPLALFLPWRCPP